MEERDGYRRRLFCTVPVVRMAIWGVGIVLWRSVNGKEVGFMGPRDGVPVPLFIGRKLSVFGLNCSLLEKTGRGTG